CLAIAARNAEGLLSEPVTPCGSCRQVMTEIEDRYKQPMRVLLYGTNGVYVIDSVKDLVPLSFVSENLHG
ncbi:MAG: cytidine deaminase, partial [Prevotella sp.]|nr:cytidine deaminase [Prevotella sp.]